MAIATLHDAVGQVVLRLDNKKFAADVSAILESTWNNTSIPTINCNNRVFFKQRAVRWLAVGLGRFVLGFSGRC